MGAYEKDIVRLSWIVSPDVAKRVLQGQTKINETDLLPTFAAQIQDEHAKMQEVQQYCAPAT